MPTGNPVYNTVPQTPPGLAGIPYMIGGVVAPMMGGIAHPYVPQNQSIADAYAAKYINDPNYKTLLGNMYGQLGGQMMNTVGGMQFMDSIAGMTGYSADQMRKDMVGFGRGFGRSMVGSMVMPFVDQAMNSAGISGGSFLGSLNAIYSNRMALMSPNMLMNPYDATQQRSAMGATSAMMQMVNGLISKTDANGNMTLGTNAAITHGFSRDTISQLAMRMAGMGAFNGRSGGFAENLQSATGISDLSQLDYGRGDFKHMGADVDSPDSVVGTGNDQAQKVNKFTRMAANKLRNAIETMSALRDMTKETDGLIEKVTALAGSDWLKGNDTSTRDAIKKFHAVTQAYNLDPNEAIDRIKTSSYTLQAAALGGTRNAELARAFGFDGGGIFRLPAQTEMLSNVEAMIDARGVRNNPFLAERLRMQSGQANARNMNTQAGVAAQMLAWARQKGVLSEDQANTFASGLMSGDQAMMTDNVNAMLTTVFGSSKRGRELMQDQQFIQRMQQESNNEAGLFAARIIARGADSEFVKRERMTAAEHRLDLSKMALSSAGMKTTQTTAGVTNIVGSIAATLNKLGADGSNAADAFIEQYQNRVDRGMSPTSALQATVSAFKNSDATSRYAEQIDLAMKRQSATNNEEAFLAGGLESSQAKAMAEQMRRSGFITGEQQSSIMKMIRSGDGKGALAEADRLSSTLSSAQRALVTDVKDAATRKYGAAAASINDARLAERLVSDAGKAGFGSSNLLQSWDAVTSAIDAYRKSDKTDADREKFEDMLDQSGIHRIAGNGYYNKIHDTVLGKVDEDGNLVQGEASDADLAKMVKDRGRQSVTLSQLATKQLKNYGYSYLMDGYYGGGKYAGNNERALADREKGIAAIVKAASAFDEAHAGDRQSLGQDLIDWAHGDKKFSEVLKVYDNDGTLNKMFKGYGILDARDSWENAKKTFGEGSAALDTRMKELMRAGKGDAAKAIKDIIGKAETMSDTKTETEVLKIATKWHLSPDDVDKIKAVAAQKREMVSAGQAMDSKLAEAAGNEDFVKTYGNVKARRDYDDATRPARHADALAFLDAGAAEKLADGIKSGKKLGSLGTAYDAAKKVISDKDVAAELKVSEDELKNRDPQQVAETRFKLLKGKYARNDRDAISVMESFRVAAADNKVTKIKGEIVLKNGSDQEVGELEGNFNL